MRWIAIAAALLQAASGVAAAQETPQESFASLALDYCAPVVSAGPEAIERVAAERGLRLGAWRGSNEAADGFEQWVRESLRATADKRIRFAYAPGASETSGPAAAIDEDARSCLVTGRSVNAADAALLVRLRAPTSDWQYMTTIEENGGSIFSWPGPEGGASASLFHWPAEPQRVTRVLVQRRDLRLAPIASAAATAAWVDRVVDVCARAVHTRSPIEADAFAPFLTLREVNERGSSVFESAPGQPAGTVIANGRDSVCLISGTGEHARAIDSAILALAAQRGLPPSERPRRLRVPKFLISATGATPMSQPA